MTKPLPTWALEEAVKRLNAERGDTFWDLRCHRNNPAVITVARLIAEYVPEPVDPLVEVINDALPQITWPRNDAERMKLSKNIATSVRRGMELAREVKP